MNNVLCWTEVVHEIAFICLCIYTFFSKWQKWEFQPAVSSGCITSMLKFMIRSVHREQDVVYQWYLVFSCIYMYIPFLWRLLMSLAQSFLLLLHIFTLQFVIRSILREILMVSEWYLICGSISIYISHFHRIFGWAYSDKIHGIWKVLKIFLISKKRI